MTIIVERNGEWWSLDREEWLKVAEKASKPRGRLTLPASRKLSRKPRNVTALANGDSPRHVADEPDAMVVQPGSWTREQFSWHVRVMKTLAARD